MSCFNIFSPFLYYFFERKALPPRSKLHLAKVTALCLLVLFFAYAASHGYLHVDTGLYHAQSIRWAEEYGAVPGLALLHNRCGRPPTPQGEDSA